MFDTDRFVEACLAATKETTPTLAVQELVRQAVADGSGVESVLGTPSTAGITTLFRSNELTVLNVIWAPHMTIYPHDHRTWAVIGIYGGQEDNAFYRRRKDGPGLEQINGRSLYDADATVLGQDVIHSVHNPKLQFTGAIHVYGGDFFALDRSEWDTPEAAEAVYSVDHTMRTFAEANERARELLSRQ